VTRALRAAAAATLAFAAGAAIAAPALTPHRPERQFAEFYAPPMPPRVRDAEGRWRLPFVYPVRLVDRLERRYEIDRSRPVPIRWLANGVLVSIDERHGPWFPLGSDAVGRDVFARLVYGARYSLGLALGAAVAAIALGALLGAVAGFTGGRVDEALMAFADFVLVLPAIYVVLALRAAMPLVLSPVQVFWILSGVLALAGWPFAARGVRALVATERLKEYAEAACAAGAGPWRILLRHLLPATRGFLVVQGLLLLPAFILAEATLSYVGLGFPDPTASWGQMLRDAGRGRAFADAPWLLAPAGAIVITILALHVVLERRSGGEGLPKNML
jgi:peptide/nickel transport system permease protein